MENDEYFLVFACLSITFGTTTLFSILRVIRIHKFSSEWMHSKVFYVVVLLQTLGRTIFFCVLMVKTPNLRLDPIFFLVTIPDSLFLITYILLVWQLFSVFYSSFDSLDLSLLRGVSYHPNRKPLGFLMSLLAVGWTLIQGVLYGFVFTDKLGKSFISKEIGIGNMLVPVLCMLYLLYLHIKYSGTPFKSQLWKSRLQKITWVTVTWSLARVVRGVMNMLSNYSNDTICEMIVTKQGSLISTAAWILVLIVSEVVCIFLVLDYAFIGIFIFVGHGSPSIYIEIPDLPIEEEKVDDPFIREDEVAILDTIAESKLGTLYKAMYKDTIVCYRKISFARISKYVVQEFYSEIASFKALSSSKTVHTYGIILDMPTVGVVSSYLPQSLHKLLHVDKVKLTPNAILKMAVEIARCLEEIHSQNRVHGHLTSYNILLKDNQQPLVADLGFNKVRKYAAIMFGYSIKSGWSSPELLKENRLIPLKLNSSDDVYSYGMLLWEMNSRAEPFAEYPLKLLHQKVVHEELRPKMPPSIDPFIEQLIISCWSRNPSNRPTMTQIRTKLQKQLN